MASPVSNSANHPYILLTDSERVEMLGVIGVDSLDDLIGDIIITADLARHEHLRDN